MIFLGRIYFSKNRKRNIRSREVAFISKSKRELKHPTATNYPIIQFLYTTKVQGCGLHHTHVDPWPRPTIPTSTCSWSAGSMTWQTMIERSGMYLTRVGLVMGFLGDWDVRRLLWCVWCRRWRRQLAGQFWCFFFEKRRGGARCGGGPQCHVVPTSLFLPRHFSCW